MGLFECRSKPDGDGYYPAAAVASVQPDQLMVCKANGQTIVLTRLDGQLYAFSHVCPHAAGDLSQGDFYRGRVDCPEHGYRFDVRSGRILWPADESYRLQRFPVKEEAGIVKVKLTPIR
ncbi:MAG: Rieske (2Fe-2S) protein [Chloroflexota bacterium]